MWKTRIEFHFLFHWIWSDVIKLKLCMRGIWCLHIETRRKPSFDPIPFKYWMRMCNKCFVLLPHTNEISISAHYLIEFLRLPLTHSPIMNQFYSVKWAIFSLPSIRRRRKTTKNYADQKMRSTEETNEFKLSRNIAKWIIYREIWAIIHLFMKKKNIRIFFQHSHRHSDTSTLMHQNTE